MNPEFESFDAERQLVGRLRDHLTEIFAGITDRNVRKERLRRAIISAELQSVILGKNKTGKTENYSQAFERLYGEPLESKSPKGKRA